MHPRRAKVRPRVIPDGSAIPVAIDSVFDRTLLRPGTLIAILGGPGTGKTAALQHLLWLARDVATGLAPGVALDNLGELPANRLAHLELLLRAGPLFYAAPSRLHAPPAPHAHVLHLAPWTDDELIEYMLPPHEPRTLERDAASKHVLARAFALPDRDRIGGSPLYCAAILDELLAHPEITTLDGAIRIHTDRLLTSEQIRHGAGRLALVRQSTARGTAAVKLIKDFLNEGISADAASWVRQDLVSLSLAVDHVLAAIKSGSGAEVLSAGFPPRLLETCAERFARQPETIGQIRELAEGLDPTPHSTAISLLHAAGVTWTPRDDRAPSLLTGAYLAGIRWPGVRMPGVSLKKAVLSGADLSGAVLDGAALNAARLERANLAGANLSCSTADSIRLDDANLTGTTLSGMTLRNACLAGVHAVGARFVRCNLTQVSFGGARLIRAEFTSANIRDCDLQDADCSGAIFNGVQVWETKLNGARFDGAQFPSARLVKCDLSAVRIPGANFEDAGLHDCDLTAAFLPKACFRRAKLWGCLLADICLEGADLRDVDFRKCAFHMGSSRSGLLFTPIASEGTRTGFYSEDIADLTHKNPEEIRKANLRACDLRGAKVEGVDFYLVDLREALCDDHQLAWFRRCGAILED